MNTDTDFIKNLFADVWHQLSRAGSSKFAAFLPPNPAPVYLELNVEAVVEAIQTEMSASTLATGSLAASLVTKIRREPQRFLRLNEKSVSNFCTEIARLISAKQHKDINVYRERVRDFMEAQIWSAKSADGLLKAFFGELSWNGKQYLYVTIYTGGGGGRPDPAMC